MIYEYLLKTAKAKGSCFLVLLDPDKLSASEAFRAGTVYQKSGADAILFGTSLMISNQVDRTIAALKRGFKKPVIIFPGSAYQVSKEADAILFMSLVSGRNSNLLIEEQVKAAPSVRDSKLEAIPTAYMLVESGKLTAAAYMSHSVPIPSDKPDIAKAHALAARYLGMKLAYLDAGSGAQNPVPDRMISEVAKYSGLPVIVGGGIRSPEQAARKAKAGALAVVVGNALEGRGGFGAADYARTIHYK
jgi:putative glycerol-1-phosphate prenyltransferase